MLTDHGVLLFGSLLLFLFFVHSTLRVKRDWRAFGRLPAYSILVSPLHAVNRILPHIPGISYGAEWSWMNVYEPRPLRSAHRPSCLDVFAASKSDIVQIRSLFPFGVPQLVIADATAVKAVFQNRTAFHKTIRNNESDHEILYGPNILTTEHDEWRKHRRIAGPTFTEGNNVLVWESTLEIILGYFIKWNRDGKGSIVKVSNFLEVTTQIAFMVFSNAGFGIKVDWDWDRSEVPKGYTMPFAQALATSTDGIITRAALPKWLLSLTKRGRQSLCGYYELEKYMLEMIEARKGSAALEERRDLLSNLIRNSKDKSDAQHGEFELTRRELLGNIFTYMFAGHESTASVLSFAVALLAVHPDEQEELYKHIRSVVPEGRLPTYQDVPQLTRVLAVIYETLRLFPPAPFLVREASEDTVIPTSSGETLPVPKGALLGLMFDAMHHNPKYWPDPNEFRPSRFLEDYNKEAFIPFSVGPRQCIGRRFTEIEQIAVLSVIVLHYNITVLEEPQYAHETTAERKTRVLAASHRMLVKPTRTPVVFTPREEENILGY